MSYENVLYESANGVARLTLNRPETLNSFTAAMHRDIAAALAEVKADRSVRVLVVTGAGRAFCAGQNLKDLGSMPPLGERDLSLAIEQYYMPMVLALRALPVPVVALVNGVAAGAGASLALACDIVLATSSAYFTLPFTRLAILPDTGATFFLPRLCGMARAMAWAILGDKLSAAQAVEWGLIWKVIEDDAFEAQSEALIAQLAQGPTVAYAATKQALYASQTNTLEQQLLHERDAMRALSNTEDVGEGVGSFLEKRAPQFQGR